MNLDEKAQKYLELHEQLRKREKREIQFFYGFCFTLLFFCSASLLLVHYYSSKPGSIKGVLGAQSTKDSPIPTGTFITPSTTETLHGVSPTTTIPLANIDIQKPIGSVLKGSTVTETITTSPGALCTPFSSFGKNATAMNGLSPMTADDHGVVTWNWTIDTNAPTGNWVMSFVCSLGTQTVMASDKSFTIQ